MSRRIESSTEIPDFVLEKRRTHKSRGRLQKSMLLSGPLEGVIASEENIASLRKLIQRTDTSTTPSSTNPDKKFNN